MIMFAEVKQDGQWRKVGKAFKSTYQELEDQLTDRVFDGRNNDLTEFLFSYGFLSHMPVDASEAIKNHRCFQEEVVYCLSLSEILDYDWDEEISTFGYITEWQYERLKNDNIEPVRVRNDVLSEDVIVTPFKMDLILAHPVLRTHSRYYVSYEHERQSMRSICEFFCTESIPALIKLIPDGGTAEDVRIIFSI